MVCAFCAFRRLFVFLWFVECGCGGFVFFWVVGVGFLLVLWFFMLLGVVFFFFGFGGFFELVFSVLVALDYLCFGFLVGG